MSVAEPLDLVIGIGHRFRSDDGAGPAVAAALAARGLPALVHEGEGSALLDMWEGHGRVAVVDAMAGGTAGRIFRLRCEELPAHARAFVRSTHDLGLPEAVALGRTFGRLPAELQVIGICGRNFAIGETLSLDVRAAVTAVVGELAAAFAR